jgi:hypothetical protein
MVVDRCAIKTRKYQGCSKTEVFEQQPLKFRELHPGAAGRRNIFVYRAKSDITT